MIQNLQNADVVTNAQCGQKHLHYDTLAFIDHLIIVNSKVELKL